MNLCLIFDSNGAPRALFTTSPTHSGESTSLWVSIRAQKDVAMQTRGAGDQLTQSKMISWIPERSIKIKYNKVRTAIILFMQLYNFAPFKAEPTRTKEPFIPSWRLMVYNRLPRIKTSKHTGMSKNSTVYLGR